MNVVNWVTADAVIAALNVEPPSPAARDDFARRYRAGNGADALPGSLGWTLPNTISKEKRRRMRVALVSLHLRNFVDLWLETGRKPDGSELPNSRDVMKASETALALHKYVSESKPALAPSIDANGLRFFIAEPSWDQPWAPNFFEANRLEAKRLLVGIMASDWRNRLCKCRHCGSYFLHSRSDRPYRRGTFCCPKHARASAAQRCIYDSRARGLQLLIEAAARQLLSLKRVGSGWHKDASLKRRLAEELCLVIAREKLQTYRQEVKVNWVTRHRQKIEQRRLELTAKQVLTSN